MLLSVKTDAHEAPLFSSPAPTRLDAAKQYLTQQNQATGLQPQWAVIEQLLTNAHYLAAETEWQHHTVLIAKLTALRQMVPPHVSAKQDQLAKQMQRSIENALELQSFSKQERAEICRAIEYSRGR